jgi:hypothetical protein
MKSDSLGSLDSRGYWPDLILSVTIRRTIARRER